MSSTRQIKSRIRSVSSNRQITKAMEMVAASKMRKAQSASLTARAYSDAAVELLNALSDLTDVYESPLYRERPLKTRLLVLITSDRGLAGAYNSNVIRLFTKVAESDRSNGINTKVITIGKKGAQFVSKCKHVESVGAYDVPDQITASDIRPVLHEMVRLYSDAEVDAVDIITTWFENSLTQQAVKTGILPAGFESSDEANVRLASATFEPSVSEVLEYATIRLLEAQLFQAVLDAQASEHSMRRIAMKNASDNAKDIIEDLTLEMNKVRQAAITQELAEISGGVEAMK